MMGISGNETMAGADNARLIADAVIDIAPWSRIDTPFAPWP
jgi:hypothetical protein